MEKQLYDFKPHQSAKDPQLNYDDEGNIEIDFNDLLTIASGFGGDDEPASDGMIFISEIKDEDHPAKTVTNTFMKDAVFQIYWQSGCSVVVCTFPQTSYSEFQRSADTCREWLENLTDPKYDDQIFTLLLIPRALHNYIQLVFTQLVYCTYQAIEGGYKLILAFNNNDNATAAFWEKDSDYDMIVAEIDAELRRQEEELDAQLEDIKEEKRQLENDQFVKPIMHDAMDGLMNNIRRKSEDEDDDDYENLTLRNQKETTTLRIHEDDEDQ